MRLFNRNRSVIKTVTVIALLAALLLTAAGCEEFGQFPTATPTSKPEEVSPPTSITTADRAILAVYEHLLSQAEGHEAKQYLAEFYTVASDNWSAEKERFKDGSSIWYIFIDMTESETWTARPYWQQAGWFVLPDGKVMPSYRLQANALRLEADLQELSLKPEP